MTENQYFTCNPTGILSLNMMVVIKQDLLLVVTSQILTQKVFTQELFPSVVSDLLFSLQNLISLSYGEPMWEMHTLKL